MIQRNISIYFFRNYLATFLIAYLSMIMSLVSFYQCDLLEATRRIILYDIYTVLYFILLWLVDYVVFEISKIIYDLYKDKIKHYQSILICVIICIVVNLISMLDLFQYNITLLSLLILIRIIKELFKDKVIVIKKRPVKWPIIKKLKKQ